MPIKNETQQFEEISRKKTTEKEHKPDDKKDDHIMRPIEELLRRVGLGPIVDVLKKPPLKDLEDKQ